MARRRRLDDVPSVYRRRANFDLSHKVPTTMKVGLLTPLDIVEVLPGDTWTMETLSLTRLSTTFIRPIMDDMFLDTYSFFVPLRLCYDKLEQVFGDVSPSAYSNPSLATIPNIYSSTPTDLIVPQGTVWDYLGLPSSISFSDTDVLAGVYSTLPVRAFALLYNEDFAVQGIDQMVNVALGDSSAGEYPNSNPWSVTNYTGQLPPVRRYGDLFSTCVLAPQKGPSVAIPGVAGAPIVTTPSFSVTGAHSPLTLVSSSGSLPVPRYLSVSSTGVLGYNSSDSVSSSQNVSLYPSNLVVADSTLNPDANINSLRTAFQLQKYLERDSIYGSRYREYLYSAYGVLNGDARMQIPEFLAGSHNRLNIAQIPATSQTDTYSVGQYAGNINSLSSKTARFSKSFTEHGYIITVGCIRYKHTYSQLVPRLYRRTKREDFYDPLFANLGQQAIYVRDVYGQAPNGNAILGYNEAFADYRTIPDRVTAGMRPDDGNIGQYWSLSDRFDSVPSLADLVHEDDTAFNRVISTGGSGDTYPFICDFNFPCSVARVVTPYSIPGYADHH